MKHLGDITKISGSDVPIVDIVCGGSPCQDLSVAGLRKGLLHSDLGDGETTRSGLFMEQIRIIKEMREADRNGRSNDNIRHIRPRYMVWENVCGAFSSNKGEDFRAVLEETAKVADEDAVIPRPENGKWTYSGCVMGDGWSIAWRTHDAQYWGVPQRRKRICLVADFDGDTAGKILFDVQLRGETEYAETFKIVAGTGTDSGCEIQPVSEGLSRDSEQGKQEREGTSENAEGSVGASSYTLKIRGGVEVDSYGKKAGKGPLVQTELSATLGVSQDQTLITGCLNPWDVQSKHIQTKDGVAESLYSGECRYGGGESYVMTEGINGDIAGTLDASYFKGCGERQGVERDIVCCLNDQGGEVMNISEDITAALRAQEHGHQPVVFEPGAASRVGGHVYEDGISGAVRSDAGDNRQAVVYGISAYESNSMKSSNPHSGIYEARTARALDMNGGSPACNQGGMAVVQGVEENAVCIGNGQVDQLNMSDKVGALNCMHDQQAVITYGLDRASFNQGKNALYDFTIDEELSAPIVARGPGGAAVFRDE